MKAHLLRYGSIAALVLVVAVVGSAWVSSHLQRSVSSPILRLARAAQRVFEQEDYGVRVESQGRDEIGALGEAFNEMLARIESRDAQLQRRQSALEEAAARTAELRDISAGLKGPKTRPRNRRGSRASSWLT